MRRSDLREGRVRPAMTAYAARGRLHLDDRDALLVRMVDDWWEARERGEAVLQASSWRDVLELNARARARLVEAGLVERAGLDVRGVTVGVGDKVMVLRNAPALGVINGTMGRVTAIDREKGGVCVDTAEPEPRVVRLPAAFWNAKGRRRLTLAYCRTVHKAQGATYHGESFTLAGDDTIHLEALHVALSRGTRANHLYYMGEPPPDEDHRAADVAAPDLDGLVAAAERSRAQVMALDLLEAQPGDAAAAPARRWMEAPMTEAQVAVLARHGVVPDGDRTWVEASLLIDQATGAPRGRRARGWLCENGASAEHAADAIARAERSLAARPSGDWPDAAAVRLEVLEGGAGGRRRLTGGQARERDALRRAESEMARELMRKRRREWARQSRPDENGSRSGPVAAVQAGRGAMGSRPPPRTGR